ncbi:MAG: DUF1127 domain-containing protein [Rhizobiaceae bacterium]
MTAELSVAARAPLHLVEQAVKAAARLIHVWRNRREFSRLGEMNDVELSDIGLTRADLSLVAPRRFGDDPTALLGSMARRREQAARLVC